MNYNVDISLVLDFETEPDDLQILNAVVEALQRKQADGILDGCVVVTPDED